MQTQQIPPTVSWVSFAIEAVKILGPATLALCGSWIALRYQRKLKEVEIDAGIRLKARELMFEAYQQRLNSETTELKELSRTLQALQLKLEFGTGSEQMEAFHKAAAAITGLMSPVLSSVGNLEQELAAVGLTERFHSQLGFVKGILSQPPNVNSIEEAQAFARNTFTMVSHFAVMNQALLDKKRDSLFEEYLPKSI